MREPFAQTLASFAKSETDGSSRADLLATIQAQIIPKLVLAHCVAEEFGVEVCADARLPPTAVEIDTFARLAVAQDIPGALAFVEKLASDGCSLEVVLLELLAPAARLLGDQWLEDDRNFTEVTIGLASIQQIVRILSPSFSPGIENRGLIVLVCPAGEQHTLGIYLCGEFLRRAGWSVQVAPSTTDTALVDMVANERIAMVGISVSNDQALGRLETFISAVRRQSVDKDVAVMVGGSHPELPAYAARLGAIFCNDPKEAVRLLDQHSSATERTK